MTSIPLNNIPIDHSQRQSNEGMSICTVCNDPCYTAHFQYIFLVIESTVKVPVTPNYVPGTEFNVT